MVNSPLVGAVALMAVALAGFATLGAVVLAWCPGRGRPTSMAPTLGAAVVVLWSSAVGLVVAPGSWLGVGSTVVAAAALGAATVARRLPELRDVVRGWRGLAAALLVGLLCALPFLVVISQARSTALVHLTGNHDAFFFTAVPEWLRDHTLVGSPGMTADGTPAGTPLIGSTWDLIQDGSWRVGSDLLITALSRVTGADPLNLWFPVTLTYLILFTTAAHALVSRLGVAGWRAPVIAGVATGSVASLKAVLDQHTPTLLATAALLVLVAELTRGAKKERSGASPPIVAIAGGAVAAVYGEIFALVALPLVALVAWPWWRRRTSDRRWLAAVAGWSLAVAAAPWVRALRGTTGGNSPEGFRSAFDADSGWFNGLHAFARGTAQAVHTWSGTPGSTRAVVLAFTAVLGIGLVLVCSWGRARTFWAVLTASLLAGWWVLGHSQHSGYPQQRLVEWSVPLLVVGALLGWHAAAERLRARTVGPPAPASWAAGSLVVAAMVLVAIPGLQRSTEIRDAPERRVDHDFAAMADWVQTRDPGGDRTIVFARDYFANLWAPHALRQHPSASYLTIYRDYYDLDHFGSLAGRRWLVLDRAALGGASLPDGALVEVNDRFALIDLDAGPVVLAVPPLHRGRWSAGGLDVTVELRDGTVRCRAGDRSLPCP